MGRAIVAGGKPAMEGPVPPVTDILASDIAVGSSVYLMENGSAVEYLVVNQGNPSDSSLYDDSCNGTWLLRKALCGTSVLSSASSDDYSTSDLNTYLNGTFYNTYGDIEKAVIKQVKIPYRAGTSGSRVSSGSDGMSCKVFIPAVNELYFSQMSYTPMDGSLLSYFSGVADAGRIAYLSGTATAWWLRTPYTKNSGYYRHIGTAGSINYLSMLSSCGIRPMVVVPSTALFDEETLIFKGVA